MGIFYISILVILVAAALFGLFVGVSNDASNFLNSPCNSKAASVKVVKIVACCGIIMGAMTSSGMMNVARYGFFHPQYFDFREVIMLYLGVMLSYVLLLDISSTMRLPISTSVALIFCLFGAAIAVSIVKIHAVPYYKMGDMGALINSGRAILIIFAILMSVVVAFILGTAVMFVSRLLFSFKYRHSFGNYGFLWCGFVFAVIINALFFNGAHEVALIERFDSIRMLNDWNSLSGGLPFLAVWLLCSAVLRLLQLLKVDLLKTTVLAGTFFLAMAFASNDLVNFVGVPLAGMDAYKILSAANGDVTVKMMQLAQPAQANGVVLFSAGLLMACVIYFSKNHRDRFSDELNLSNHDKDEERFGTTLFSRMIVRCSLGINDWLYDHTPRRIHRFMKNRFTPLKDEDKGNGDFDLIRVTVNLVCAAVLISSGTALGVPLSTTYATFMVAMGTSFADRTWDRESAVYRITGIITVVSGWFFTAVAAFLISIVVALLIMVGGMLTVGAVVCLCIWLMIHNAKIKKRLRIERQSYIRISTASEGDVLSEIVDDICDTLNKTTEIYQSTIKATLAEDRKTLREMVRESNELYYSAREKKYELLPTLQKLHENYIDTGQYYVQVVDYISEITKSLLHITRPCFEHIDNNHRGMSEEQVSDLLSINGEVAKLYNKINMMLKSNDFSELERVFEMRDRLFEIISQAVKNQLRRIQTKSTGTKASLLYLTILNETKTMVLQSRNLIKSQSYFVETMGKK